MYRCIALFVALSFASVSPGGAQELPTRLFPKNALRGVITFGVPPEVVLNGAPARLSPGARLRAQNNMMVLSGGIQNQELPVVYKRDSAGLVHEVWILTPAEFAKLGGVTRETLAQIEIPTLMAH